MAKRLKFTGLEMLHRSLYQIPINVQREVAIALETGAKEISETARNFAPTGESEGVNSSNNPGALKNSIGWTWGDAPKGTLILGNRKKYETGPNDMKVTVFAGNEEAFYARWVEFGTAPHVISVKNAKVMSRAGNIFGTTVSHPGARVARPFFYPAYRSLRKRVQARITRSARKAIRNGIKR